MPVHKIAGVEDIQRSLGDRIRQLRSEYGWSQEHFATICGLHRTYMGHVERGEKNVSLSTVVRICDGLGIRVSDLFAAAKRKLAPSHKASGRKPEWRGGTPDSDANPAEINRAVNELRIERRALQLAIRTLTQLTTRLKIRGRR